MHSVLCKCKLFDLIQFKRGINAINNNWKTHNYLHKSSFSHICAKRAKPLFHVVGRGGWWRGGGAVKILFLVLFFIPYTYWISPLFGIRTNTFIFCIDFCVVWYVRMGSMKYRWASTKPDIYNSQIQGGG